jgi:hypothetical protein
MKDITSTILWPFGVGSRDCESSSQRIAQRYVRELTASKVVTSLPASLGQADVMLQEFAPLAQGFSGGNR